MSSLLGCSKNAFNNNNNNNNNRPVPPATCARSHIYSIVQRFNSVLIHESFVSADEEPDI